MLRALVFISLFASEALAAADVTARYRHEDGRVLIFEVNEAGIVRIGVEGANGYFQLDGTEIFAVSRVGSFTEVEPMSDSLAATEAAVARMYPRPQAPAAADGDAQGWVAAGPATVEGRAGIAYRLADEPPPEVADIVLSEDAQLAPLGRAWSRSLDIMPILVDTAWTSGDRETGQLGELMATRAPLQYGPARLISVSFDRIEPARFVLPVPFTREDALERIWQQRRRGAAPEGEE